MKRGGKADKAHATRKTGLEVDKSYVDEHRRQSLAAPIIILHILDILDVLDILGLCAVLLRRVVRVLVWRHAAASGTCAPCMVGLGCR